MRSYYATYGIYTNGGCSISHTEDYEFDAFSDEDAIEEAKAREKEMEDYYAFVMLDELVDEDGNNIKIR